jgi:energy-coupling factor transporter ATP-binding protein EcfA2
MARNKVPAMTVRENQVLTRDGLPAVIDSRRETRDLERFLAQMPFDVPLDARVSSLSADERQKCETLKQLYLERRFLILDKPTSVLTPGEADEIFGMLRRMVSDGDLTVLMITHKFRGVMAFADEVTICGGGKLADGGDEISRIFGDRLAGHRIHDTEHVLGAMIDLPRQKMNVLLVRFPFGDVAVSLKRVCFPTILDTYKPALDHHRASVTRGVGQFSVPTPFAGNLAFDLLHWDGGPGPKQLVATSPDRLLGRVFVQALCALAPVHDAAADLPGKNCIMRLIQEVGLALQQFPFLFALGNISRNF